jgi:cytochrome c-type biogenesis protein CcmH
MAVPMLKQALQKQPDFVDAYLHLALAYLRLGRAKDADQIVATAQKRFPGDADAITQFYAQMRARVKQAPRPGALDKDVASAPPAGPDNPHADVDAAPAPPGSSAAAGRRVAGTVELDPALQGQLPAGGVLFVFARATGVSGGPPAAAKRLVPSGFPLRFELTDADSMMGQPLPGTLRLEARLDTDGDPRTQDPKDPKGVLDNVAVGTSGLKLVLTR